MKLKYCILSLLFFYLNISSIQAVIPQMEVSPDERGVSSLVFQGAGNVRNYVDHGKYLGDLSLTYEVRGKSYAVSLADITPLVRYRYSGSFLRMCVFTKLLLLKEKK